MTNYHARRKGLVINAGEFPIKPIARPSRFTPIGSPPPTNPRDPSGQRFQKHLHLVTPEARYVLRKVAPIYDLKTLKHFGSIGLWDACRRFTGNEVAFQYYARVRIRGQIWDEIRGESTIHRKMLRDGIKPHFDDIDEVVISSHLPPPDDLAHLREVLAQVDSVHLCDRERQVLEALANGDYLLDLAPAFGTSKARISQIKTELITKMKSLIRKADL